jgi:hypothetical protein
MQEQYVNDIVASTFVHELVNMKADREYLSPLQATIAHYIPPTHISKRRPLYLNPKGVLFSTIAP